ncbi:ribosomal protein L37AE/L43A [Cytobacillus eiseniae]|uniref:Ribosomal protein L37AE/L43A n=2 Tax=Cytobacillus eiseniae TaxID=762947 RepID=A0ABS4RDJ6_9BACI|nr:ribosomal protein L37AE/L43A [Cytobacillus eiseniae]
MAGYQGEKASDYFVKKLPEKEYLIFHGLRLQNGDSFFQMDTMILSKKLTLNLEIKNYIGTIYFDSKHKQLIQSVNNLEKAYLCPIVQAKRQREEWTNWLKERKIQLPLDYLVVISNPSTIIKSDPQYYEAQRNVIHPQEIGERMNKLSMQYTEDQLTSNDIKKLAKLLIKNHIPETYDVLSYFKIPETDIITGVQCLQCEKFGMERIHGTWHCPTCQLKNKDAHLQAMNDYFLLINSTITNKKLCEFLHLSSPYTASRLLKKMNLPYTGSKKGRMYTQKN